MQVEVTISVSEPPNHTDLENLKAAAAQLTNQPQSISVEVDDNGDYCFLITCFSMKSAAQSQVVNKVHQEFQLWTTGLEGYQDMTISFS